MSESVYLIREQGSGEPRVSPSPLIELMTNEKGVERPGSLSPFSVYKAKESIVGKTLYTSSDKNRKREGEHDENAHWHSGIRKLGQRC